MTYTPYGEASMPRLEIHAVVGGPYRDEQEATASQGGNIPANEELQKSSGVMEGGFVEESVYVLQRASIVAGSDFRTADPGISPYTGQREVRFTLTKEAGDRFYEYTNKNVGQSIAVVMGGRIREVAVIKSAIRDSGVIQGSFSPDEVTALSKLLRTGAKQRAENYGSLSGAGISNTQYHCSVSADDEFDFLRWLTR
jgi:preprotein translocase subunit SecD